jgi:hypothetical protein
MDDGILWGLLILAYIIPFPICLVIFLIRQKVK